MASQMELLSREGHARTFFPLGLRLAAALLGPSEGPAGGLLWEQIEVKYQRQIDLMAWQLPSLGITLRPGKKLCMTGLPQIPCSLSWQQQALVK